MTEDYELLDSGDGRKLERFGKYVLARPCSQAMWRPAKSAAEWERADASFDREDGNRWHGRSNLPKEWRIETAGIRFRLGGTDFGHLGIFPEQRAQWNWIRERLAGASPRGRGRYGVLNLFAYSGGSTMAAALGGAEVFPGEVREQVVATLLEGLGTAERSGRERRAEILRYVLAANQSSGELERRRAELRQILKDAGYYNDPKPLERLGLRLISGRTHWKLQYANVRVTMSKTPSDYRANLNHGNEIANRCF